LGNINYTEWLCPRQMVMIMNISSGKLEQEMIITLRKEYNSRSTIKLIIYNN